MFAFPSAYEEFLLAFTEAMEEGLLVIGFSYAPSVNELICDSENGYLCKNKKIAKRMEDLMKHKEKRVIMEIKTIKSVQKFAPNIV